ncbi:MAG: hypothetical protein IPO21_00115 [Bacteroidales bacterium]|nr:hypothetical protein [Bacteroidales bacterium]
MYINGVKDGKSYEYDIEGFKIKDIPYKNGQKNGIGFDYDKDGTVIGIYTYQDNILLKYERVNRFDDKGNKLGIWKDFYENGSLKFERNYVDGMLNGVAKSYNAYGQVEKIYKYQENRQLEETDIATSFTEPEETISYYESGSIKSRGLFKDSLPFGIHRNYDENGTIVSSVIYSNSGAIVSKGIVLDNGLFEGNWINYHSNATIASQGIYKNGKKEGLWKFFSNSGILIQEGYFKADKYSGVWTWFSIINL